MKDTIVVRDGADRWEFLQTPEPCGRSALRVRAYDRPDGHWSLTAEARRSATMSGKDPELLESREEPNTLPRPTVPEHVIELAVSRAGVGSRHVVWP